MAWVFILFSLFLPLGHARADCFDESKDELKGPDLILKRFTAPLDLIQAPFAKGTPLDQIIADFVKNDIRKEVFRLEELLHIYSKGEEKPQGFEKRLELVKAFEDRVGLLVDRSKLAGLGVKFGAPPEVQKVFAAWKKKADQDLRKLIREDGWDGAKDGKISELREFLGKRDWTRPKIDRGFLIGFLLDYLKTVKKTAYEMRELQTGLHEFRRDIRRVLILAQSLRGKLRYTKEPASLYPSLKLLTRGVELPANLQTFPMDPGVKRLIEVPLPLQDALSALVTKLGELKDDGELVDCFADAYKESHPSSTKKAAHDWAVAFLNEKGVYHPYLPDAEALYGRYEESRVIPIWIEVLRDQL